MTEPRRPRVTVVLIFLNTLGAEVGVVAVLHTWGQPCIIIRTSIASCRAAARR